MELPEFAPGLSARVELTVTEADTAQSLVDTIVGRINQFRGNLDLPDDLTLVCIQTQTETSYRATEAVSV